MRWAVRDASGEVVSYFAKLPEIVRQQEIFIGCMIIQIMLAHIISEEFFQAS